MRIILLFIALLSAAPSWAWKDKPEIPDGLRHQTRMEPIDGLTHYPVLELDDLPVAGTRHYVAGWKHPLRNINQISAVIADDSGYYIAGTALHSEDVGLRFNREAVNDLLDSPFRVASSDEELFSTVTGKNIAVSLFHLAPDGTTRWVNSFENDLVSSGPMTRLPDGRILLALTPLAIDEENSFSSFLFFLSPEGKLLQRKELKEELINSLFTTASGEVLAGVIRREVPEGESRMGYQQYACFLDDSGRKIRETVLAGHPGDGLFYQVLTLVGEYGDGFVISGGDSVFILDKAGKKLNQAFLRPVLDRYADYYIDAFHRDDGGNLTLLGFYGREKSPLVEMKINYLQSVSRPTIPGQDLSPAYQRMRKNPLLRGIYDDMLSEMRAQTRERGTPFKAVLTKDWELINLIDPEQEASRHTYAGSAGMDGRFLIERIRNGEQEQYYLLDDESGLLASDRSSTTFCDHRCLLQGSMLIHLQWDAELPGFVVHQGEFAPVEAQPGTPASQGLERSDAGR